MIKEIDKRLQILMRHTDNRHTYHIDPNMYQSSKKNQAKCVQNAGARCVVSIVFRDSCKAVWIDAKVNFKVKSADFSLARDIQYDL